MLFVNGNISSHPKSYVVFILVYFCYLSDREFERLDGLLGDHFGVR